MSNKYEQLVEFIINDETDKARELFHTIVVEKSRDIYESLMDESDLEEVGGNQVKRFKDEVSLDEQGMTEEEGEEQAFDSEEGEAEDGEFGAEEFGSEEGEEEIEDRVQDLESALDELKAEFDALMAGEEHEEEQFPGIHGDELSGTEEVGAEEFYEAEDKEEDDEEEEEDLEESIIREYVDTVADTGQKNASGKMAGTGSRTPQSGDKNTKSIVASKNDMGGTAKNIAKGGSEANPDGTTPNSSVKTKGELVSNPQNKPGANAGKTAFKTKEASTGAEGKLAGADGSRPINKVSPVAK